MKKILISGLITGCILFILSYGGLFLAIRFYPALFTEYNNPLFNSNGSRDVLFYMHAFIISFALSWFWDRFKGILKGTFLTRGIEFGLIYVGIATVPMLWLIYSAMNVSLPMVATWLLLALLQGTIAGLVFEKMNP